MINIFLEKKYRKAVGTHILLHELVFFKEKIQLNLGKSCKKHLKKLLPYYQDQIFTNCIY